MVEQHDTQDVATSMIGYVRVDRDQLGHCAPARRVSRLRIFVSAARGDAGPGSGIGFQVCPSDDASLIDLTAFEVEATAILEVHVDVVSDRNNGPLMGQVRSESIEILVVAY